MSTDQNERDAKRALRAIHKRYKLTRRGIVESLLRPVLGNDCDLSEFHQASRDYLLSYAELACAESNGEREHERQTLETRIKRLTEIRERILYAYLCKANDLRHGWWRDIGTREAERKKELDEARAEIKTIMTSDGAFAQYDQTLLAWVKRLRSNRTKVQNDINMLFKWKNVEPDTLYPSARLAVLSVDSNAGAGRKSFEVWMQKFQSKKTELDEAFASETKRTIRAIRVQRQNCVFVRDLVQQTRNGPAAELAHFQDILKADQASPYARAAESDLAVVLQNIDANARAVGDSFVFSRNPYLDEAKEQLAQAQTAKSAEIRVEIARIRDAYNRARDADAPRKLEEAQRKRAFELVSKRVFTEFVPVYESVKREIGRLQLRGYAPDSQTVTSFAAEAEGLHNAAQQLCRDTLRGVKPRFYFLHFVDGVANCAAAAKALYKKVTETPTVPFARNFLKTKLEVGPHPRPISQQVLEEAVDEYGIMMYESREVWGAHEDDCGICLEPLTDNGKTVAFHPKSASLAGMHYVHFKCALEYSQFQNEHGTLKCPKCNVDVTNVFHLFPDIKKALELQ